MRNDQEFDHLCEKALACKSEEEAFEIIQRLRPYFQETRLDVQPQSGKDGVERDDV